MLTGLDLIKAIHNTVMTDPAHFNMSSWINKQSCGTTMCVAGWALVHNGFKPFTDAYGDTYTFANSDGEEVMTSVTAASLLWPDVDPFYSECYANHLFWSNNDNAIHYLEACIKANAVLDPREVF